MKRYLLVFTVLTLAVCVGVAVFNYRVDPYGIYHFGDADEARLGRIDQLYHLRLIKPWLVADIQPTAIITGTSRSATVHPQHPAWPEDRSYNLSIPSQTAYEMLRFVEHAQANGPLDKLMIGLDFEVFIQPEPHSKAGFEESRLAREAGELDSLRYYWRRLGDIRDTLFSVKTLTYSLAAFTGTAIVGNSYFKDGTWVRTNSHLTGQGGVVYFGKENVLPLRAQRLDLDANMAIFADILRFAHRQHIDTRLFVTPEHVFIIDLWARLGYEDLWNDFHRRLVAVNDAVAAELGVAPFPLYGFNHMRGVVDEPIRKARDAGQSVFTDGSHFRPALGETIMAGVWSEGSDAGVRLNAASVDSYLSEVAQIRQQFERDNAQLAARLRHGISPELQ